MRLKILGYLSSREALRTTLLLVGVVFATFLFGYLHEWAHAAGYFLQGTSPCVALNNSWPSKQPDTLYILGGLLGPLFTLAMAGLLLCLHLRWHKFTAATFTAAVANATVRPFSMFIFALSVVSGGHKIDVDEAILSAMLPATVAPKAVVEAKVGPLNIGFLATPWSLPVLWLPFIFYMVLWAVLLFKGRPLGDKRNVAMTSISIVTSIVAGLIYGTIPSAFSFRLCF